MYIYLHLHLCLYMWSGKSNGHPFLVHVVWIPVLSPKGVSPFRDLACQLSRMLLEVGVVKDAESGGARTERCCTAGFSAECRGSWQKSE